MFDAKGNSEFPQVFQGKMLINKLTRNHPKKFSKGTP
tara:strand:+ start:302 stop:412 length:111 start_codon:yes stop_codon:yes gene_type:complete